MGTSRRSCLQKGDLRKVTAESSVRLVSAEGEMGRHGAAGGGAERREKRPTTIERARGRGRGNPVIPSTAAVAVGVTYLSRSQRSRPLSLSLSLAGGNLFAEILAAYPPSSAPLRSALSVARRLSFGGEGEAELVGRAAARQNCWSSRARGNGPLARKNICMAR